MESQERILFFIKFGYRKYLEKLRDKGEVHFKSTKEFNNKKKYNNEQGDENEGAIWIDNIKNAQLTLEHPEFGELKFKSTPNKLVKLTQYNHNYLTCSFYAVTEKDFKESNTIEVDERMSEFGDSALIITNPTNLIDKIFEYASSNNLTLTFKKVNYGDFSQEGKIEIDPFMKKMEHSYQKECRFVLDNCIEESKTFICSGIENCGIIVPTIKNEKLKFKIQ